MEKEGGEAERPPDDRAQGLHPGIGRRLHFGSVLLWPVCSLWCGQEELEVRVCTSRGTL